MSKLGVACARLRTQDGGHLFTLKRPTDNELACLEFETEVADRDQVYALLTVYQTIIRIAVDAVDTCPEARPDRISFTVDPQTSSP